MSGLIRIVVVLDAGADRNTVEAVIPAAAGVELLTVIEGLNNGFRSEFSRRSTPARRQIEA